MPQARKAPRCSPAVAAVAAAAVTVVCVVASLAVLRLKAFETTSQRSQEAWPPDTCAASFAPFVGSNVVGVPSTGEGQERKQARKGTRLGCALFVALENMVLISRAKLLVDKTHYPGSVEDTPKRHLLPTHPHI